MCCGVQGLASSCVPSLLIGDAAVRVAGFNDAAFAERATACALAVADWWPQPWARMQVHGLLALMVQWYKY